MIPALATVAGTIGLQLSPGKVRDVEDVEVWLRSWGATCDHTDDGVVVYRYVTLDPEKPAHFIGLLKSKFDALTYEVS